MKKRNFTLVELLAVTALIVILAGIGFAAFSYASNRGKEAATKSLITRIAAGLESVRTKHGSFPGNNDYKDIRVKVNSSTGLIESISFDGGTTDHLGTNSKQLKTFLTVCDGESLKKNLTLDSGSYYFITDSWGGRIKYRCPGKINTVKFDLVAPGPDEGFGTDAKDGKVPSGGTEANMPAALSGYRTSGEWACDDIANFN